MSLVQHLPSLVCFLAACSPSDRTWEMPQVAAGCVPSDQWGTLAGKLKAVIFTSITQRATEPNYMQIVICK